MVITEACVKIVTAIAPARRSMPGLVDMLRVTVPEEMVGETGKATTAAAGAARKSQTDATLLVAQQRMSRLRTMDIPGITMAQEDLARSTVEAKAEVPAEVQGKVPRSGPESTRDPQGKGPKLLRQNTMVQTSEKRW